jgi:hypothetical protein
VFGYAGRKNHLKDAGFDVSANGVFRNRKYVLELGIRLDGSDK